LSLSAFCDLVWLELWDDCPAMGDQAKYREAINTIFIEGREVGSVEVIGPDGKKHTIRAPGSAPSVGTPIPAHAMKALQDMKAQIAAARPPSE